MNKKPQKFMPFIRQEAIKKLISECPICQSKSSTFNIKIIEEREEAQLTYIKCRKCEGRLMALIVAQGPMVSSFGLITDLDENDILKFKNSGALKEDDVLKIHDFFKQHSNK